jgi:hypothetical protein
VRQNASGGSFRKNKIAERLLLPCEGKESVKIKHFTKENNNKKLQHKMVSTEEKN